MTSKEANPPSLANTWAAPIGLLWGLSVAAYISPHNEYFLENFALSWVPHAVVLAVVLLFRSSRLIRPLSALPLFPAGGANAR
jgi:hypothetical protein